MQKYVGSCLLLAAALWVGQAQAGTSYPHMAPLAQYLSKSAADEIALARSAAPADVSDKAQVLTLDSHGYEVAVKGSNGFVCLVERSWELNFNNAQFWDPSVRTPMCFNAAAAHSVLREFIARTGGVIAGMSTAQMAARNKVMPPLKGSMAYMMSRQQLICANGACNRWYPHLMFFFPTDEVPNWGANQNGGPVFPGRFNPLTAVFFVVVPTWSDGTPSVGGGTHNM